MIELEDVTKVFTDPEGRKTKAVHGLSLSVAQGETLSLIGTSGCGKSTTMKLINRLLEPTSGVVRYAGKDVQSWDPIRLRRSIGYVVATGGLFPHMTAADNIGILCGLEGWAEERTATRVRELLALVNLDPDQFAGRYPKELSGGQRQRVGLARALALDPDCVLMDEPFGALDPITRDQIHDEFVELRDRVNKTIILVTHDMDEAFKLANRVALMSEGQIVQLGEPSDFLSAPATPFVEQFLQSHWRGHAANA